MPKRKAGKTEVIRKLGQELLTDLIRSEWTLKNHYNITPLLEKHK